MKFLVGQAVKVSDAYHWAQGAFGRIAEPPEPVRQLTKDWSGCVRDVKTVRGMRPYYWVEFNEPHRDSDGDGPYSGAEIPADHVLLVSTG